MLLTLLEYRVQVINWKQTLEIPLQPEISDAAKDMIVRLCCGPEDRLGVNGATEIKSHAFFHGVNFDTLRKQESPYVPNIRYATDTSYFDPVDPDKCIMSTEESEEQRKKEKLENGKHPEHAFFEFTFRRFFDDGGHAMPPNHLEPILDDRGEQGSNPDSNSPVYV